jgi:hypothetical protein
VSPAAAAFTAAAYAIFAFTVMLHGIPVLRHDWNWPLDRAGVLALFWEHFSGWRPDGIGYVNPYQIEYSMSVPFTIAGYVAGPVVSLLLMLLLISATIVAGARRLAQRVDGGLFEQYVAAAFALYNPWVYGKVVAGHYYMLIAYGALMWLVGELWDRPERRRPFWLRALFVALTLQQLQFFLAALLLVLLAEIPRRRFALALAALAMWSPIGFGILFDRGGLLEIEYLLPWERAQSVEPGQGALLFGYYAHYANGLWPLGAGMWCLAATALGAFLLARRTRAVAVASAAYLCALVAASGTKWFAAPLYTALVLHVPESAVLRELYDLVAICAYALLVLIVIGMRALRPLRIVAAGGCVLLVAAWLVYPPARFWPHAAALPRVSVTGPAYSRFLLLPALQPLQFDGAGSGEDYEAFSRGVDRLTPLNEYYPTFPSVAAIARYVKDGNRDLLRTLSVSRVFDRPGLRSDSIALRNQRPFETNVRGAGDATIDDFMPMFSLAQPASVVAGVPDLNGSQIALSDADPQVRIPAADRRCVESSCGWIDMRLEYWDHPELAQGMGGVFTTGKGAFASDAGAILTSVRGELRQGSNLVTRTTHGFVWVRLTNSHQTLTCSGACAIALEAPAIPNVPRARKARWAPVEAIAGITPWLWSVVVPAGDRRTLRYNTAFDAGWAAFDGSVPLHHFRLDAAFNGWMLPAGASQSTVWVVHWVAAIQALLECLMFAAVPIAVLMYGRRAAA